MSYKLTFEDGSSAYLEHHGVKGMHWGVWNAETRARYNSLGSTDYKEKGGVMPSGTNVSRVATSAEDKIYDNKKYLSTNPSDHKKWEEYLGPANRSMLGKNTYNIMYETTKSVRIASNAEQGKLFADKFLNSTQSKQVINDTVTAYSKLHQEITNKTTAEELASMNMAAQTETGKRFVEELLKQGYGGVSDVHGQNVADDPVILFNPSENLKRVSYEKTKY